MDGELLGIEVMLGAFFWVILMLAAFFLVGAWAGIIVIFGGIACLAWWLVRVIRAPGQPDA
jgi:hypothetical protein